MLLGKGWRNVFGEQGGRRPQPKDRGAATRDFSWEMSLTWCYLHRPLTGVASHSSPDPALICNGQAVLARSRFVECPLFLPAVYRYFHSRSGGLCFQCVWHRLVSGIEELKVVFIGTFSGCQPALLLVYLLLLDLAGSTLWSVRNWALESHRLGLKYLSVM